MKTAISIPDPLFKRIEQLRKKLQLSRSELFACAVERFISELGEADVCTMSDDEITRALDRSIGDASGVDPILTSLQHRSLREDW